MLVFTGFEKSLSEIRRILANETENLKIEYQISTSTHPVYDRAKEVTTQDLYVVIAARHRTLSFTHYIEHMPRDLARYYENKNFIIIYPEHRSV